MRKQTTTRRQGREMQVAWWLLNHPRTIGATSALSTVTAYVGPEITGGALGAAAALGAGWYRAHPASFDRFAAPRLRAWRRRWFSYQRRWNRLMHGCELARRDRLTGEIRLPRLVGLRSISPCQDVLDVKLPPKCRASDWQDAAEDIADQLRAERIVVDKTGPGRIRVLVEAADPFDEIVPAPEIPDDVDEVDLAAVEIGQLETGVPYRHPVIYSHTLCAGASGSGKGSFIWDVLRGIGPTIQARTVRVHTIDPKGLMETIKGAPLFTSHYGGETSPLEEIRNGLRTLRDRMKERQAQLRQAGLRKFSPSVETPLELIVIDEMASLVLGGRVCNEIKELLIEIMTQGRACGYSVLGCVQEPTKENVIGRELFTHRLCLRVTSDSQVEMVLGDGARDRGALADHIPAGDDYAGQGYVLAQRSRLPQRLRLGWSSDEDLDELVRLCTPSTPGDIEASSLVAV